MTIKIEDLEVCVDDKKILKGIDLEFKKGKNYLIIGKNGSGKSTLVNFLMGNPRYIYKNGLVKIDGKDVLKMSTSERSKEGMFLSFQNVPEIEGIRLGEFLRIIYNLHLKSKKSDAPDISPFIFKRLIKKYLEDLSIGEEFLDRDLNVGFSGGEKRKIEILQMKLIEPKYIFLDEIDSGLDINALRDVGNLLKKIDDENNSLIIITHQFKMREYLNFDEVIIIEAGKIKEKGGSELIERIWKKGF